MPFGQLQAIISTQLLHLSVQREIGSDRNEDVQVVIRPYTKRPCEKHPGETDGREHHREAQEGKTEVVWPRKEARPRIRRKKDSGDGTTWEKIKRKTKPEMGGLCQPRHESRRNDER